ncbi:uncharacterized protein LOC132698542 [Cylas formicarius]|uniref:uncharacterized protein LOC132698542 n=1 Tax=Cylas formicarius TaxID=197179 RepID=UPI0029583813|nr:uncharacterized protein LOC132698542 [Cylas formicarius]
MGTIGYICLAVLLVPNCLGIDYFYCYSRPCPAQTTKCQRFLKIVSPLAAEVTINCLDDSNALLDTIVFRKALKLFTHDDRIAQKKEFLEKNEESNDEPEKLNLTLDVE